MDDFTKLIELQYQLEVLLPYVDEKHAQLIKEKLKRLREEMQKLANALAEKF